MEISSKQEENPQNEDAQIKLIKEIEPNFDEMKNTIPTEIKEEIITIINKFTTIIKDLESIDQSQFKSQFIEKLGPLNSLINSLSQKIKNYPNINPESKKCLTQIKKSMFKLNTLSNNPSIITKLYYNGKYKGDFLNNKREGKGIYIFSNGDKYEGHYKNNLKEGFGIYSYKNGDIYEGNFKNDKYEGKGVYKYSNGDIYEGEYKKDLRDGKGIYIYNKRNKYEKYEGQWSEGKKQGKGSLLRRKWAIYWKRRRYLYWEFY